MSVDFASVLGEYGDAVRKALRESTAANAQAEEQLKAPTITLFERVGGVLGFAVSARPEARMSELSVRPDLGVLIRNLLSGHVELKAPGLGANPEKLKDPRNREQWRRLQSHPNLIYTDGNEWGLYRDGERQVLVKPSGDVVDDGGSAYSDRDRQRLEALLRDFLSWQPVVPSSPRALADALAPLCRLLREDVTDAMQNPNSQIRALAKDWRDVLFPDADDAQFADAYAQTLTYALLLARLEGETNLMLPVAAATLRKGHALLGRALGVLGDPDVTDEIGMPVDLLQRSIAAIDPEKLKRGGTDPWLYFYEDFLAAYDPKLRKDRGVYYTPVEVVRAQVNLVSSLLQSKFDKPLSFADDDVTFLDPAVGTGTYPLAAIDHALALVKNAFGEGSVPARASTLARNMHAFEILVGPYAVAHLRITQAVFAAGGELPEDGVHVYLTDTLESPHSKPEEWHAAFAKQLTDEHRKALVVKRDVPILVCMGNPPYDRQTITEEERGHVRRKGGWVRFGDGEHEAPLQDFLRTLSPQDRVHAKNLYNDYVYFWRWALWKAFEASPEKPAGIVSFITASSYLRGPWAKGMRERMRRECDEVWVIDLEGDNLGPRKTENVFAIQNPVAIAICVRYGKPSPDTAAVVRHTRVGGSREEKLVTLDAVRDFDDLEWEVCGTGWDDPFVPGGEGRFFELPLLTDLFPWQHAGVQTKRPWVIGESRELLATRWTALLAAEDRARYLRETPDRKVEREYPAFGQQEGKLGPLGSLPSNADTPPVDPLAFRVLDRQYLLVDGRLIDRPRPALWETMSDRQLFLTTLLSTPLGSGPAAFATSVVPDMHHFRGSYGGKDTIPLWRDAQATRANVANQAFRVLGDHLGEVLPGTLFSYVYALLSSPSYVERFSEELLYSPPRVPICKDRELFDTVASAGETLIWLHTFGERFIPKSERRGRIPRGEARSTKAIPQSAADYPDESPQYDAETRTIHFGEGEFAPVSQEVWDYSVSGYKVVESWLKARTRSGSGKTSSPLDEIRPSRWTAEMTEEFLRLLWILEATVEMHPRLESLLDQVLQSDCFGAKELPEPMSGERKPPERGAVEQQDLGV